MRDEESREGGATSEAGRVHVSIHGREVSMHPQSPVVSRRFPDTFLASCLLFAAWMIGSSLSAAAPPGGNRPPAGGSPQSGQNGSQSVQPNPIPLELKATATCTGARWNSTKNIELSREYNTSDWDGMQETLGNYIDGLTCNITDTTFHEKKISSHRQYFSVVFLNEGLGTPALSRVLVHRGHEPSDHQPEIYGNRAGEFTVLDLQLLPRVEILVDTQYQVVPGPSPLVAQVSSVLTQVAGAFKPAGAAGGKGGTPGAQLAVALAEFDKGVPPSQQFILRRVDIPSSFKPWDSTVIPQVTITDQLSFTPRLEAYLLDSLVDRASKGTELAMANRQLRARYLECRKAAGGTAASPQTTPPQMPPPLIPKSMTSPEEAAEPTGAACLATVIASISLGDDQSLTFGVANLFTTYSALLSQAASPEATPPQTSQLTLGHLTRFAFTLGAAGIVRDYVHQPVKVVSMFYAKDGPATPLTYVGLDIHPARYDETRFSPSWQERFRCFVAAAVAPAPGLVGGVGFGVFRGLAIEAGTGVLAPSVLPAGAKLGDMVKPSGQNPTPRKATVPLFFGLGYSFQ
jgi:hypothetical protein